MRIPLATYRLQFGPSLRFLDVKALVPYLSELGISDIYASPILKATPGSTHGYDVTDPDELNPELGTWEDFQALTAEVQAHGMGWLQDVVPNHMAYSSANWMLMDVFENGPRSRFHEFFDIFRDHPNPELRTKVLAPFLGNPLEEVLQRGEMRLVLDDDGLAIQYSTWRFPLYLASYDDVLGHGDPHVAQPPPAGKSEGSPPGAGVLRGGDDPEMQAFTGLRESFARLSGMDDSSKKRARLAEAKKALVQLRGEHPTIRVYLDGVLESYNHPPEGPIEHSPLYRLLEQQVFKPVFWQRAYEEINYRRFFYLSEFISLRTEDPRVFQRVHARMLELARAGVFTGLRVDHIDGLYNPRQYLLRLHQEVPEAYLVVEKILELYEFLRTEWPIQGTSGYKFCNYVNGIFCQQENEEAFTEIYRAFIGAQPDYFQLLYDEKKKILESRMAGELAYLTHLALQAAEESNGMLEDWNDSRFTGLRRGLTALMAAFPVYRTYVDAHHFTPQDRALLARAAREAADRCPECQPDVDRLVNLLLSAVGEGQRANGERKTENGKTQEDRLSAFDFFPLTSSQARRHFLMRFQQFTGPAMAKGLEDTLLYVYNRFVSLNEVGGDPSTFGLSLDRFHRFLQLRARDWPHAMNATSTHDSKRGEDIRARLNVLSEMPERWRQAITRWAQMNERHKQRCGDSPAPDRNDEYLLYQTLVGAMPTECGDNGRMEYGNLGRMGRDNPRPQYSSVPSFQHSDEAVQKQEAFDEFKQRVKDYLVKAIREAKRHGNWVQPDEPYEAACRQFVDRILDRAPGNRFWADFLPFQREISGYGLYNSLSQTTLKITCTGLPDFYQGSELWDLNLVDPDNRRPVDFEKRARLLREVQRLPMADFGWRIVGEPANPPSAIRTPQFDDGRIKLFLIHRGLRARRENRNLFDTGDYLPASVTGSRAQHVVAFFRVAQPLRAGNRIPAGAGVSHALVVAPRFLTSLVGPGAPPLGRRVWGDTDIRLPEDAPPTWQDAITGETRSARGHISVGDVLATFPAAILVAK